MTETMGTLPKAPHLYSSQSQRSMVAWVCAAIAPSLLWGVFAYGLRGAAVLLTAVGSALIAEGAVNALLKRFTLRDGTAFLTGLIVGASMPAGVPLIIPALASCFAILVVKWSFGGLGSNWMNPAMAGATFAYIGWPRGFDSWYLPRTVSGIEGVTGSTPIMLMREQAFQGAFRPDAYAVTGFDTTLTASLNELLFRPLGASLPGGYIDLLVGNRPGAIGELSIALILLGTIMLIAKRIIRWEISASVLLSFSALTMAFGGIPNSGSPFSGDALFALCSGSIVFVAFFCATDPVSSPTSFTGRALYGAGIGTLAFLFRFLGEKGDGAAFAVIIMDCFVPLIDSLRLREKAPEEKAA